MNGYGDIDPQSGDDDRALGTALGGAISRRSEALDRIPPVVGVVERAATAASARRLRYSLVGVATAAALVAGGLVAWNTLSDDGSSVQVATAPATSAAAPAAPQSGTSRSADPPPAESQPADPQPSGPERADAATADSGLDGSEPAVGTAGVPAGETTGESGEPANDPETESAGCEAYALTDTKCKCSCPEAPFEHFFKGRIAKNGYELRFGEPPGGMTLWDLIAEAPVYELEPEALEGGPVPDGVRVTQNDNGSVTVVFEHPETGEELVTVTTRRTSSTGLTFEGPFEGLPDLSFEHPPDLSIEDLGEYLDDWLEDLDDQLEDLDDQLEEFDDRFEDFVPDVDWSALDIGPADLLERLRERLNSSRHHRPNEPTALDVRVDRA